METNANLIENAIFAKVVASRDGSALYTAQEVCENYVTEACALLNLPEHVFEEADDENVKSEIADEYERKLSDAGFTTVVNDGFVIYKGLTDEEKAYLNESGV